MIDLDKSQFSKLLLACMQVYDKAPDQPVYDAWFRALKPFSLGQIQDALDQHVKFGRYAPRPGDITRRINGTDDKGDTKEGGTHQVDRRCVYEQNGSRCPAPTGYFHFGNRGYCSEHGQHQHDPAHMQRILDDYLQNGVPGPPPSPHRQRAEYLYAKGGAELVLAGIEDADGTRWGPYDQRVLAWLRLNEQSGGVQPRSYVSPEYRPRTVAEATGFVEQPAEPELEF